jgi:hypothetical protein
MSKQKKISTLTGITTVFVAAVVIFSGVFIYQYFVVNSAESNLQINNNQLAAQLAYQTATWQTYTNKEGKFSIKYPSNWELSTSVKSTPLSMTFLIGTEGSIQIDYGTGFGGACPQGYEKMDLGGMQFSSCHSVDENGAENWVLDSNINSPSGIGMFVTANKPYLSNENLVLKILSTFKITK